MSKFLRRGFILGLALVAAVSAAPVAAQGPVVSVEKAVLTAAGQTATAAYLDRIAANTQTAWIAAKNTFSAPPQKILRVIPNGSGQVTLPGNGPLTQVGSYTQDLVIPNRVPVIGGWDTHLQTTVDIDQDAYGNVHNVPVDPLSTFNYAFTHPVDNNTVRSGLAIMTAALGNYVARISPASGDSSGAGRWDPGLVAAFNATFGQGLGVIFGAADWVQPADTLAGVTAGMGSDSGAADAPGILPSTAQASLGALPPSMPAVAPPLPSAGEQIYLKAVIPQAPPNFAMALQPPYPVVVGQDPAKRGVDVSGQATLYPCTVIWHHVLHEYYYYYPHYPNKDEVEIRETTKEWDTTQLEPDALASAAIDATLSPESVAYINGPLAERYPGAHVYQGHVTVYPSQWAQVTQNYVGIPSGWAFQALRVPFEDPGQWDFHVALTTTGTPHCAPLHWSKDFPRILTVWLREQRLTK